MFPLNMFKQHGQYIYIYISLFVQEVNMLTLISIPFAYRCSFSMHQEIVVN